MPVDPPGSAALDQVARHYGLGLGPADVASFEPFVDGLLGSWDAVERLYAENAPQAPDRPWKRPAPADNPLGAWYVTTSITERSDGPLAGRSVAIKDNTAVAGVPMMNGSSTLEGFQPARDATVVSRLLAAGATIAGKAVCEDLCFSGGSHTSRSGPVRNPWDTARSAGGSSSGSAALLAAGVVDIATGGDQGGSVRELAPRLRAAYDEGLGRFEVLVMPTLPVRATVLPGPDAPREEILARGLEMIGNTAPLDVTGHPACSVPAGLADGLPVGMMIIGKHFGDATVLRVAHAFEQAVGGFPAPRT
jgi:Asp-tRNA(Asn)/Glu-tRNA(Gln) amidotransferase A subunit family amidase